MFTEVRVKDPKSSIRRRSSKLELPGIYLSKYKKDYSRKNTQKSIGIIFRYAIGVPLRQDTLLEQKNTGCQAINTL